MENQKTIESQESQIKELQAKVDEAAPYFYMKAEEQAKLEEDAKTKVLSNGNYESGKDFEVGTYDIVAVSGGGNVISSNMYSGGINAIMGSDEKIAEMSRLGMSDMYKKEYKNIKLPKGVTLKLNGVEVKLVPVE